MVLESYRRRSMSPNVAIHETTDNQYVFREYSTINLSSSELLKKVTTTPVLE